MDRMERDEEAKSPLDEFIEDMREDWLRSSGITTPDFIEKYVRLAVQKHAESVIPEKTDLKYISDSFVAVSNGVIDEIKSASDKWR